MPIATPGPNQVILTDGSTSTLFNLLGQEGLIDVQELGKFQRKITIGDYSLDSQDYISTWVLSNLAGGHGVQNHGTDETINRYRYATIDATRPEQWVNRRAVTTETGTAGTFIPLGDLLYSGNVEMYGAFGTDLHVWNETTDAWTDTTSNLAAAPVNPGVAFAGTGTLRLFIPLGSTGYDTYTGATHASVAASGSTPAAKQFCVLGTQLLALDTSNQLWWTVDGTTWTSFGVDGKVDAAGTAYTIVKYTDQMNNPIAVISTSDRVWTFDPAGPTLYEQDLDYPNHPDQGLAAEVYRGQYVTSVGMGMFQWSTASGQITPFGLDRDDGLPFLYSYNCKVVGLASAYNELYALVQGSTADGTESTVHRFTGQGWSAVWEAGTTGTVSDIYVSQARSHYRVWWGMGNNSYTILLPRGYANSKELATNDLAGTFLDTTGYLETGMTTMGMDGYRKIAHSAKVRWGVVSNNAGISPYISLYYRLRDNDSWTQLYDERVWPSGGGSAIAYQTSTFLFDSTRYGVAFDEIELRLVMSDPYMVVKFLTMDFIKVPRLYKAWTMTLDLSAPVDNVSPDVMSSRLSSMVNSEKILQMVHRGTTYYCRLASWTGQDKTGKGDTRESRTVQVIETPFDALGFE